MSPNANSSRPRPRPLRAKLRELGLLTRRQEAGLPRFLILGGVHSGAGDLARVLQQHPGCSLPAALGTRYFSSLHQWCDLDWYIHALGDDVNQVRGEWTCNYVLLPVRAIRLIHELAPQLRIVFLLSAPEIEAWHAWQQSPSPASAFDLWRWVRADSLGQMRRWSSVFPAEQFFIGFSEQLSTEPHALLHSLCEFLQIAPLQEVPTIPAAALEQPAIPPNEFDLLRVACGARTEELATWLRNEFRLQLPASWTTPAATGVDPEEIATGPLKKGTVPPGNIDLSRRIHSLERDSPLFQQAAPLEKMLAVAVKHELDDVYLQRALGEAERAATVPQWLESWDGYDVYLVGDRIAAVPSVNFASESVAWERAVWGDDLPSLRARILRRSPALTAALRGAATATPELRLDGLPIYGDVLPRIVMDGYRGFSIAMVFGAFFAFPEDAVVPDLATLTEADLNQKVAAGELLRAPDFRLLMQAIDEVRRRDAELDAANWSKFVAAIQADAGRRAAS